MKHEIDREKVDSLLFVIKRHNGLAKYFHDKGNTVAAERHVAYAIQKIKLLQQYTGGITNDKLVDGHGI